MGILGIKLEPLLLLLKYCGRRVIISLIPLIVFSFLTYFTFTYYPDISDFFGRDAYSYLLMACLASLSLSVFFTLYVNRDLLRNRPKSAQVLTWAGWDDPTLQKDLAKEDLITYEIGWETPAILRFGGSEIDIQIVDYLYLERYNRMGSLAPINEITTCKEENKWLSLVPLLRHTYRPNNNLGFPVEFGFSELLVNTTKVSDQQLLSDIYQNNASYNDFKIENLLDKNPEMRIGLWDWYIPAILHFLAIYYADDEVSIDELWKMDEKKVTDALLPLSNQKYKERFILHPDLNSITEDLEDGKIGLTIGAGSSALKIKNQKESPLDKVTPIVPKEGLFIWCNCFTISNRKDTTDKIRSILDMYLDNKFQEKLNKKSSYRSLPVTRDAMEKVFNQNEHPSASTLKIVFENINSETSVPKVTLASRRLPLHWQAWHSCWEKAVQDLRL